MAIRRTLLRSRRGPVCVFAVVVVAIGVALHHSDVLAGEVHHDGMTTVVETCLGAITAVGAAVAVVALGLLMLRWPKPVSLTLPSKGNAISGPPHIGIRAGPAFLHRLQVLRL